MVEVAMGNQNQISIIRRTNLSFRIHLKWAFWVAFKPWIDVDDVRVALIVKLESKAGVSEPLQMHFTVNCLHGSRY